MENCNNSMLIKTLGVFVTSDIPISLMHVSSLLFIVLFEKGRL